MSGAGHLPASPHDDRAVLPERGMLRDDLGPAHRSLDPLTPRDKDQLLEAIDGLTSNPDAVTALTELRDSLDPRSTELAKALVIGGAVGELAVAAKAKVEERLRPYALTPPQHTIDAHIRSLSTQIADRPVLRQRLLVPKFRYGVGAGRAYIGIGLLQQYRLITQGQEDLRRPANLVIAAYGEHALKIATAGRRR